ncbi:hypothetical protein BCR36DRAFT_180207 [Piromyces finnis]|uniref:Uncharacterized protein n=1 Tax=Piromyces finnis TaxID=1754191 RepID=A0A1Y1UUC4_9FUNG|nr:hypothetical protein BCR36DRAFT_180207 [Piromyces finnis]|eukprot:ORX41543.1 hypothetical protein BCR36DRAFT_180207 [Piromyces finnis]
MCYTKYFTISLLLFTITTLADSTCDPVCFSIYKNGFMYLTWITCLMMLLLITIKYMIISLLLMILLLFIRLMVPIIELDLKQKRKKLEDVLVIYVNNLWNRAHTDIKCWVYITRGSNKIDRVNNNSCTLIYSKGHFI